MAKHTDRPTLPERPFYRILVAKTPFDVPKWYLNNSVFESWDGALREVVNMEKEHVQRGWDPYYVLSIREIMIAPFVDPIPVG